MTVFQVIDHPLRARRIEQAKEAVLIVAAATTDDSTLTTALLVELQKPGAGADFLSCELKKAG